VADRRSGGGTGPECGKKVICAAGVENVGGREPCAAELADAIAHLFEAGDVVCVCVDGNPAAALFGDAEVTIAEVEAIGVSVVLDRDP
jgi:1-aminocyclopropane-1-carboxylate deaminase/D-cysteine desulfhydrase-like pyridoxal-dependent ACC family enzyme